MEKEYDFSKGIRGKFYNNDTKIHLPVYLEPNILSFVKSLAEKRKTDISKVVNDLIKSDMKLIEYAD